MYRISSRAHGYGINKFANNLEEVKALVIGTNGLLIQDLTRGRVILSEDLKFWKRSTGDEYAEYRQFANAILKAKNLKFN